MRCTTIGINFMFVEQTQTLAQSRFHTESDGEKCREEKQELSSNSINGNGEMEWIRKCAIVNVWPRPRNAEHTKYIAYIRHSHLPIAVCIYITLTHNSHTKHSRAYLFASANKFVINIKILNLKKRNENPPNGCTMVAPRVDLSEIGEQRWQSWRRRKIKMVCLFYWA